MHTMMMSPVSVFGLLRYRFSRYLVQGAHDSVCGGRGAGHAPQRGEVEVEADQSGQSVRQDERLGHNFRVPCDHSTYIPLIHVYWKYAYTRYDEIAPTVSAL